MKRRILASMVACVFVLQLAACGEKADEQEAAEAIQEAVETVQEAAEEVEETAESAEAEVGLANPWVEITEEQALNVLVNPIAAPEGATNVRWSAMGDVSEYVGAPGPLVQLDFTLDGMDFTAREKTTGDSFEDISGMYYDWTVSDDVTLANWAGGNMQGKTYRYVGENEFADLITWYDVEMGESYTLSVVAPDLDGFDIQAVAEAMYDPDRQASAMIP